MLATAVSVPTTIVAAVVLARSTGSPAPVQTTHVGSRSAQASCQRLYRALPDVLDGARRNAGADGGPFYAAWGTPAIVLRCAVPRPAQLAPYSTAQLIGSGDDLSVTWLPVTGGDATVWTTVDRGVYIALTVPTSYATPPINALSNVIARALPAVCAASMTAGTQVRGRAVLCTHRR